jgi:transglutaminase-like putative cysteine protease
MLLVRPLAKHSPSSGVLFHSKLSGRVFFASVFLMLALSSLSFSQIEAPQLASIATVRVEENGTVRAVGGEMSEVKIEVSVPLQGPYQSTQSQSQVQSDQYGNQFISIQSTHPSNPFSYHEEIIVHAKARRTDSLPESYVIPESMSIYLSPTLRTQSDNAKIRATAQGITSGSADEFEKVAKLAIWVHQNMKYNDALVGQENDAVWALQNRQGVCVEYSTLFIALARSIGIPARYVTGYVYSDKFSSWMGHAWAEAYVGQWVPVDPTWFEVGTLDAMHIEAAKFPEISREPALTAMVSPPSATLAWETSQKGGVFASNIAALDLQFEEPENDFIFSAAETNLPMGESTIAYLSMEGKDYRVVQAKLTPCLGEQAITTDTEDRYLIMRPGKATTAAWVLQGQEGLEENYVYTCPFTLNSPTLESRVLEVKLDPRLEKLQPFSAKIEKFQTSPSENNSVLLTLPYSRQGKSYFLITSEGAYNQQVSTFTAKMPFMVSPFGDRKIYAAAQGGGYQVLEYGSGQNSTLKIDVLTIPDNLIVGKHSQVTVQISSSTYPQQVHLELDFAGQAYSASGVITQPTLFSFQPSPRAAGDFQAELKVATQGKMADQKTAQVSVSLPPAVAAKSIKTSGTGGSNLLTTIIISSQNSPLSTKFLVGSREFLPDSASSIKLNLPEGDYQGKLSWADAAGNAYYEEMNFTIRRPAFGQAAAETFSPPKSAGTCPIPLAVLGVASIGLFIRRR